jgi:hypothetical protein
MTKVNVYANHPPPGSKKPLAHAHDHVILGPQPAIDVGSGRCFWRASTHPDPEMAKTGKRQREAGGGGSGGGKKKGDGQGQGSGGGGAGAGLELPGACVPVFLLCMV